MRAGVVVARAPAGGTVLLSDVAVVADTVAEREASAWYDGRAAVGLLVYKEADANTVAAVNEARATLDDVAARFGRPISVIDDYYVLAYLESDEAAMAALHDLTKRLSQPRPVAIEPPRPEKRVMRDDIDATLLPIFLEEAQELVPAIGSDLRDWKLAPHDALIAQSLQRGLHTLKGSARMTGLMRLGELTAIALSLPLSMWGSTTAVLVEITFTWPPSSMALISDHSQRALT